MSEPTRQIVPEAMITETVLEEYQDLDLLPTPDLVSLMTDEYYSVMSAVTSARGKIADAIDAITPKLREGGRLFFIGAGTSGRLGILEASEIPPTFSTDPNLVIGIIAGGDYAIRNAIENAEDDESAGKTDLAVHGLTAADCVVGLSASGRTPYVLGALRYAEQTGSVTVSVSCNPNSAVSRIARVSIEVVVGPEVLAGSTRMKAGSAQKQVLNILTTSAMMGLGKTYGNLMVDLKATNAKLRARSLNVLRLVTRCSQVEAEEALAKAKGSVKTAIVMVALEVDAQAATDLIRISNGHIRPLLTVERETH